ncbi:MAG: hypothetical protein H7338_02575 [Candidatus Sericytochromatia bacterium]|nr:hypothetical protein [Candidatus Sericytochromatia bacterium]
MLKRVAIAAMAAAVLGTAGLSAIAAPPSPRPSGHQAPGPAATPPQKGMVWANAKSKVYHTESSQHYGRGKNGTWMTETAAKAKGFHAIGQRPPGQKPDQRPGNPGGHPPVSPKPVYE